MAGMADVAMVGRDRELQRCDDASARPGCVGVVLVGHAGVGKTALAGAFASKRYGSNGDLLRISASESASSIPLGAVAPLLTLPTAPTAQADLIRHTVAALVARSTQAAAKGGTLVILVDDAHLLDDASATLVHQLALTGTMFLIVTIRSQETVSDSIIALWKDGLADRLDIDVLGLAESTALASAILGSPLSPSAAMTLFEASGGNPLFLQQLVASARETAALALVAGRGPVAGRWSLVAPLPLPPDLVSAVEGRLEHLADEDRSIVELLALGEPLDAEMLEELAGHGGEQRLERLEAAGFIVADHDRQRLSVRLGHPMYGEVLRATMPSTWANRARLLLADTLASRGRPADDAMRIATWRLDALATIPSTIATIAAQQALLRFDPELAERIVRSSDAYRPAGQTSAGSVIGSVIGNVEGSSVAIDDATSERDAEAELLLATIASFAGRPAPALDHLDQLDRILDGSRHDGRLRSRGAVLRFDVLSYILGRFDEAFALEVPPDGDRSVGSALTARKAIVAVTIAQPRLAESLLAELSEVKPGTRADVWVSLAHAMTHASRGRLGVALAYIDRAEAAFEIIGWDPSLPDPAIVVYVRIRTLQHVGRLREASELADKAVGYETDRWSVQAVAWVRLAGSSVERMLGRPLVAEASAIAAAAVFQQSGSFQLEAVALAEAAAAAATAGDGPGAHAAAMQCDETKIDNFYTRAAHAWDIIREGRVAEGVSLLVGLLTSRRGREAREETLLILDIVRLGGAADVVDAAAQLAQRVDGELTAVVAAYAAATVADDGPALEQIAEQFAGFGFSLPAAEAAFAACAAHLRDGQQRRSSAFLPRAEQLRAALEGVHTPGLHPPHVQALLAPREREVAALAATGATSRAIADALGLSQRTVESYVQNAYDKLGLASRAELAAILAGSPTPDHGQS